MWSLLFTPKILPAKGLELDNAKAVDLTAELGSMTTSEHGLYMRQNSPLPLPFHSEKSRKTTTTTTSSPLRQA